MRNSIWLVLVVGLALVGCGEGSEDAEINDGALAQEALDSEDFVSSKCPVKKNSLNAIQENDVAPARRSAAAAVFENSASPQRTRASAEPGWGTKYPLIVAVDRGPVDVAVMDDGDATVRLAYVERPEPDSIEGAYQRLRLVPCAEDAAKKWRFWPGEFVADREDVCVKLAVRDGSGEVSIQQVSLGNACPEGVD